MAEVTSHDKKTIIMQYKKQVLQEMDATLSSLGIEQDKTLRNQSLHYIIKKN